MIAAIPTILRLAPWLAIAGLIFGVWVQTTRLDAANARVEAVAAKLEQANAETATANASLLRCRADNLHNETVVEDLQRDRRLGDTMAADEVKRLHEELARKPRTREIIREKACTGPVGDGVNAVLDILQQRDRDAGPGPDDPVRVDRPPAAGSPPRLPGAAARP